MSNKTKIGAANIKDNFNAKLLSFLANNKNEYTRIFYFGQVMVNKDDKNANRVKVRIPLIDDILYKDVTKEVGDSSLPWCIPFNGRFVSTPENNSIVAVILSDPKTPFFGRIYIDAITELTATDLFERLTPEEQALSNWLNVQDALDINIGTPIDNIDAKANINYKVGIRGKGKNKLVFDKDETLLTQNHKDKNKESFLKLAENSQLETADKIDIISKKGKNKKYHPVFDTTLFEYLEKQNRMIQKIVMLLNTIPAISPQGGPCTAGPQASQLISEFVSLKAELKKLKQIGYSEKITIN